MEPWSMMFVAFGLCGPALFILVGICKALEGLAEDWGIDNDH